MSNFPDLPSLATSEASPRVRGAFDKLRAWFDLMNKSGGFVTNQSVTSLVTSAISSGGSTETHTPPQAVGVIATGGFAKIIIEWDSPVFSYLAYTEIWRSLGTDVSAASLVGTTNANLFADLPPALSESVSYNYWIRHVSNDSVPQLGPFSTMASAATANDPEYLLDNLLGQLGYAQFSSGNFPIRTVAVLPTLPDAGYPVNVMVLLTTTGILYKNKAGAWANVVNTTDISGTITNAQIEAMAASKITGQLTDTQLAAIAASKVSGQLTDAQIAAIASTKITGQLTDAQLSAVAAAKVTGQITTTQITDGAIATAKIAAGAVVAASIASGAIVTGKLAAGAVTAAEIAAGAITAAKIATGAITAGKIAADAVTATEIAAGAITASELAAGAVTAGKIDAGAVTATEIAAGSIVAAKIATGAVTAGKIAADAVTATEIAANSITSSELAANAITAGKIAAGAIVAGDGVISNAAIGTAHIIDGTITNAKIANLAVDAAKIANATIVTAKIADGQITNAKIVDAAITTAKIVDAAITNAKIANLAVDAAKIAAAAITTAKIGDAQITTAKIANAQVDTLQIKGNAVTVPAAAYTSGAINPGAGWTTVQTVTLDAGGGDVMLFARAQAVCFSSTSSTVTVRLYEGSTLIQETTGGFATYLYDSDSGYTMLPIVLSAMVKHTPSTGAKVYTFQVSVSYQTVSVSQRSLVVLGVKR